MLEPGEGFVASTEPNSFFEPHFLAFEPRSSDMGLVALTNRRLISVPNGSRGRAWRWRDIKTIQEGRANHHGEILLTFRDQAGGKWRWWVPEENARLLV